MQNRLQIIISLLAIVLASVAAFFALYTSSRIKELRSEISTIKVEISALKKAEKEKTSLEIPGAAGIPEKTPSSEETPATSFPPTNE